MAVPVAAQVAAAVAAAEGRDGGRAAGSEVETGGAGAGGGGDGSGVAGGGGQLDDGGEEVLQLPRRHTPGGARPTHRPTNARPQKESKRDTLVNLLGIAASLLRHL